MATKIFVWCGPRVLNNYSSGLVVVAAESRDRAWVRLFATNFRAAYWLQTGRSSVWDQEAAACGGDPDPDWVPIEPEEFEPDALPVLVVYGGE